MIKKQVLILLVTCGLASSLFAEKDQILLRDGNFAMTRSEITAIVEAWPKGMRDAALRDEDARLDFLGQSLSVAKMSKEIDKLIANKQGKDYWLAKISLDNFKAKLLLKFYKKDLVIPDMLELAKERYKTRKELYAKVPEMRESSHILFACNKGCNIKKKEALAEKVLAALKNGADFEEMVLQYSDDPGSKRRGGKLGGAISKDNKSIVRPYIKGLFSIDKVGDYANIVKSKFGYHIIKLNGIEKEHYKTFDEVKDKIIRVLEGDYKKLSAEAFQYKFLPSESAKFEKKLINKLFDELQ